MLIKGLRGPGDFPAPASHATRNPLWRWSEVAAWFARYEVALPTPNARRPSARSTAPSKRGMRCDARHRAPSPSLAPAPRVLTREGVFRHQAQAPVGGLLGIGSVVSPGPVRRSRRPSSPAAMPDLFDRLLGSLHGLPGRGAHPPRDGAVLGDHSPVHALPRPIRHRGPVCCLSSNVTEKATKGRLPGRSKREWVRSRSVAETSMRQDRKPWPGTMRRLDQVASLREATRHKCS